jgi:hypothetical protein
MTAVPTCTVAMRRMTVANTVSVTHGGWVGVPEARGAVLHQPSRCSHHSRRAPTRMHNERWPMQPQRRHTAVRDRTTPCDHCTCLYVSLAFVRVVPTRRTPTAVCSDILFPTKIPSGHTAVTRRALCTDFVLRCPRRHRRSGPGFCS